ncbi:MAG: acyl-CoA dehydrogenase [Actinophytocola sp.]|uniref:acyl-CoA dehydrogenase family protein n=1 Tax=Actinophytocola sp. TaxID=1872138 RepID=UPI0013255CCB|nr:acyl-CoA dehydrogenase [Actinophytocola sp.]MPZ81316.1 acyl-CoA dehydrogenase [Actinophytocola sp.]
MDLTLTEDQELIQRTAREFLAAHDGASARFVAADPAGYSAGVWKEIVELGWTGLAFDESLGAGFLEACLLVEELGRFAVPSPLASAVSCGMAVESLRDEVAAGRVYTFASAVDGVASLVPYAASADGFVVADGDSVTVVSEAADITRQDVIGLEPKYRVRFSAPGTPVDVDPALVASFGAAAVCAEMVGGAQAVLDATVSYASQREQFGKPIGAFQAVQHHCANMAIDVLGARFIAYEAIWRLGRGLPAATEVAVAKSWVSEAYQRVCALGHQVHGAIGFTAEHDLHYYTRHAIASALSYGDPDTHTEALAHHLGL